MNLISRRRKAGNNQQRAKALQQQQQQQEGTNNSCGVRIDAFLVFCNGLQTTELYVTVFQYIT